MTKIAIVSDSTGCIPVEELKEFDIHVNYISIVFGTESYREFKDMSVEQFMERCENYDGLPTTSQPSPGATIELYESLFAQGYEDIIHINISSQLSGSHQTAKKSVRSVSTFNIQAHEKVGRFYSLGLIGRPEDQVVK